MNKAKYAFVAIALIFLILRTIGLGSDISNTDAYRWHGRSTNFLNALKQGDFKNTYQHYQPGVTLMWLNSFVKQTTFSYRYHILNDKDPATLENADWFPTIHFFSKLAIVFTLTILLIIQLKVISKLINQKTALIYGLLVSLEPYLIGIDRWFHLTSLETYFAFTSILILLFWNKSKNNKFLYISAVFFALSFLSKITTLIISPVILFILFKNSKNEFIQNSLKFGFVFLLSLFIFFPALVTNFSYVVNSLYTAATNAVSDNYRNEQLNWFTRIFFYDFVLLFKLSPITLFAFFYSVVKIKRKDINNITMSLGIIFICYYLFLTISQQKIDRYSIAMFPTILLFTAIQISKLNLKKLNYILISSVLYIFLVIYLYFPVFSAYYSPIFGGTNSAIELGIYDNSGEYFAQAAYYLNEKGREINTYVPNGRSSFVYFYKGNLVNQVDSSTNYVVSSLDLTRKEFNNYECSTLEKTFGSREKSVVAVFSCK